MPKSRQTVDCPDEAAAGRASAPTSAPMLAPAPAPLSFTFAHSHHLKPHQHSEGWLVYAETGILVTSTDEGTWVSPTNRVTWTPPGFTHSHRAHGETAVRRLSVPRPLSNALPPHPAIFSVTPLLREALLALTDRDAAEDPPWQRLRRVALDELHTAKEHSLYLPAPSDSRLRAVTDQLHRDPASTATLAELGRTAGASERTLSRLFREELRMTFPQWRTMLRLQHALAYLRHGHTVTDTATLCGWSNPTSFIDAFTHATGQTPYAYVTRHH